MTSQLPQLIGTPKQITWATNMRAATLAACEQYVADAREDGEPAERIAALADALDRLSDIAHADAWIALRSVRAGYQLLTLVSKTTAGAVDKLDWEDPQFFLAARMTR